MDKRGVGLILALQLAACPASASDWRVDRAKSTLGFSGVQVGEPFAGRFERFEAKVSFDPAKPETGRATVLVDLASARTGDVQRDEALPQDDWFDVKSMNQARFEATSFAAKGGDAYEATGTLAIRGVVRSVTLPFHLSIKGSKAHANGHLNLLRTDFGVGRGSWSTGEWVALEVGVDVDIVADVIPAS